MKIIIQDVPKKDIPRGDVGNYKITPEAFVIEVASMQDWRYEALLGLHEYIESLLVHHKGIDFKEIDDWDEHNDRMGSDPNAPYHKEHVFAENIERLFAECLGVNWEEYDKAIDSLT